MKTKNTPKILVISGNKNSGKTTLLEKLVPEIKKKGISLAIVKHAPHGFDMDYDGTDTYRFMHAGSDAVVVSSKKSIALIQEVSGEVSLSDIIRNYLHEFDLVLAEGYRQEKNACIEVLTMNGDTKDLTINRKELLAVVGDCDPEIGVPFFSRNDIEVIADFIITKMPGL